MIAARVVPLLFAVAPVLALLSHNTGQAHIREAIAPLLTVVAGAYVLYALLALLLRSESRAALLVAIALLTTFSYEHIAHAIAVPNRYLVPGATAVVLLFAWLIKRSRVEPLAWVRVALVFGLVQCGIPAFNLLAYAVSGRGDSENVEVDTSVDFKAEGGRAQARPDIYYIVLDRYTDGSTLEREYGFDNSGFLGELAANDFYVADDSRANYLVTSQSLASSLNLMHIGFLTETMGRESSNWYPLHRMMERYRVWQFLKTEGYEFHHLGPAWSPTASNGHADYTYQYETLPEFSMMLCQTTIFYPLLQRAGWLNPRREKWARITRQFGDIGRIASEAGDRPRYVFAHFLLPHGPYVFAADGSYLPPAVATSTPESDLYVGQVRAVNGLVLQMVRDILRTRDGSRPPVIVVQGDEGPYPVRAKSLSFDWTGATDREISQKMRILNAIHAPLAADSLYAGLTPVNTFRIIFNGYFGTELPRLPDQSYTYRDLDHLYDFIEVTDQINSSRP